MTDQPGVLMIIGGAFILVGIVLYLWDRHESLAYRDQLMQRPDMREFLTNWPPHWWLKTLHLGGSISLAIGIVLLGLGLIFHFTG